MFGSKEHKGWLCRCCDGKDENCRCMHHTLLPFFLKALLALVVLIFVFAAGVWVGKISAVWHMYRGDREYQMMYYWMNRNIPMMNRQYNLQNLTTSPLPWPQQ